MFSETVRLSLLAGLFGTGSWIAITGLWLEMPILIERLPEGKRLASQLNLVIQSANVGPLLYWLLNGMNILNDITGTHLQLMIGIISSIVLIFFWQTTVFIFGAARSIILFICTFGMALVDCTSSITFLTFMSKFDSKFMSPYLIGEGLSGFVPSLIAILQGVGIENNDYEDVNRDTNSTLSHNSNTKIEPRFPVEIFLLGLCGTLSISYIAFLLLQFTKIGKDEMKRLKEQISQHTPTNSHEEGLRAHGKDDDVFLKQNQSKQAYYFLLALMFWNCFTTFGFMPSIQPFAAHSYGKKTLHYVVILAGLSYPFGCSFALFLKTKSIKAMLLLTMVGTMFAVYIIYVAFMGSITLFGEKPWGGTIMIGAWVAFVSIVSYAKTLMTVWICDFNRSKGMFWVGMATQFGGCFGAAFAYVLVNHTTLIISDK